MILGLVDLLNGEKLFGGKITDLRCTRRVDVKAPGGLAHGIRENLLPLGTEHPVHENFGGIRMGRVFEHSEITAATGDISPLLEMLRQRLYREACVNERTDRTTPRKWWFYPSVLL